MCIIYSYICLYIYISLSDPIRMHMYIYIYIPPLLIHPRVPPGFATMTIGTYQRTAELELEGYFSSLPVTMFTSFRRSCWVQSCWSSSRWWYSWTNSDNHFQLINRETNQLHRCTPFLDKPIWLLVKTDPVPMAVQNHEFGWDGWWWPIADAPIAKWSEGWSTDQDATTVWLTRCTAPLRGASPGNVSTARAILWRPCWEKST